jgi:FkbM family methyltransferase
MGKLRNLIKEASYRVSDTLGTGLPFKINGHFFRVDPRYISSMSSEYETLVSSYIQKGTKTGDTCFDIGSNVGIYTLLFSKWAGPDAKIVAFEPNPTTYRALETHVRLNELGNRVTAVNAAVSDVPGMMKMFCSGFDGRSRLGSANEDVAATAVETDVKLVTVDQIADELGLTPDVMKIDVEGFELQVLRGAVRSLERGRGRTRIFAEMHPTMWEGAGTSGAEVRQWLADFGLKIDRIEAGLDPYVTGGVVQLSWK